MVDSKRHPSNALGPIAPNYRPTLRQYLREWRLVISEYGLGRGETWLILAVVAAVDAIKRDAPRRLPGGTVEGTLALFRSLGCAPPLQRSTLGLLRHARGELRRHA